MNTVKQDYNLDEVYHRQKHLELHQKKLGEILADKREEGQCFERRRFLNGFRQCKNRITLFNEREKHDVIQRENDILLTKLLDIQTRQPINNPVSSRSLGAEYHMTALKHHKNFIQMKNEVDQVVKSNAKMAQRIISQEATIKHQELEKDYQKSREYKKTIAKYTPLIDTTNPVNNLKGIAYHFTVEKAVQKQLKSGAVSSPERHNGIIKREGSMSPLLQRSPQHQQQEQQQQLPMFRIRSGSPYRSKGDEASMASTGSGVERVPAGGPVKRIKFDAKKVFDQQKKNESAQSASTQRLSSPRAWDRDIQTALTVHHAANKIQKAQKEAGYSQNSKSKAATVVDNNDTSKVVEKYLSKKYQPEQNSSQKTVNSSSSWVNRKSESSSGQVQSCERIDSRVVTAQQSLNGDQPVQSSSVVTVTEIKSTVVVSQEHLRCVSRSVVDCDDDDDDAHSLVSKSKQMVGGEYEDDSEQDPNRIDVMVPAGKINKQQYRHLAKSEGFDERMYKWRQQSSDQDEDDQGEEDEEDDEDDDDEEEEENEEVEDNSSNRKDVESVGQSLKASDAYYFSENENDFSNHSGSQQKEQKLKSLIATRDDIQGDTNTRRQSSVGQEVEDIVESEEINQKQEGSVDVDEEEHIRYQGKATKEVGARDDDDEEVFEDFSMQSGHEMSTSGVAAQASNSNMYDLSPEEKRRGIASESVLEEEINEVEID